MINFFFSVGDRQQSDVDVPRPEIAVEPKAGTSNADPQKSLEETSNHPTWIVTQDLPAGTQNVSPMLMSSAYLTHPDPPKGMSNLNMTEKIDTYELPPKGKINKYINTNSLKISVC